MSYLTNQALTPSNEEQKTLEITEKTPENRVLSPNNPTNPIEEVEPLKPLEPSQNETNEVNENDFSNEAYEYLTTPRELKAEAPQEEEEQQEEIEAPQEEEEQQENSFGLTKEDCYLIGDFIADTGDITIPEIAAYLHEKKDSKEFRASPNHVKNIGKAWGDFLYQKQINVSPSNKILIATSIAYMMPLAMGVKHRFPQIKEGLKRFVKSLTGKGSAPIERPTIRTRKFEAPQEEEEEEIVLKDCKKADCKETFEEGKGFAKSLKSKNYDSFCSNKCMFQHTGAQSKKSKK